MFTCMIQPLKPFNEKGEVDGDTLSLDGNTQSWDGLETFTLYLPEYGLTPCHMNSTIFDANGYLKTASLFLQGMKNGIVGLAMNS